VREGEKEDARVRPETEGVAGGGNTGGRSKRSGWRRVGGRRRGRGGERGYIGRVSVGIWIVGLNGPEGPIRPTTMSFFKKYIKCF
jgi:hypothetical protein